MATRQFFDNKSVSEKDVEAEKTAVVCTEYLHKGRLSVEDAQFLANWTEPQRKAVLRKIDWRLVPMLLVLYLISFIDRKWQVQLKRLPQSLR